MNQLQKEIGIAENSIMKALYLIQSEKLTRRECEAIEATCEKIACVMEQLRARTFNIKTGNRCVKTWRGLRVRNY